MAEAEVPVDFFNPGQVFACIGLAEVADVLLGEAEVTFDWSDPVHTVFRIRARGDESPVVRVLSFLDTVEVRAVAVHGSASASAWKQSWGPHPTDRDHGLGYPFPEPDSPAALMCELSDGKHTVVIDHWGEATKWTGRDSVKFWAGSGGYPGAALARDALALVQGRAAMAADDPFALSAPQSSSFRFDWRRDYIPIDVGFSLNAHGNDMATLGFPLVEVLAAIGMTNARPKRPDRRDKLVYQYAVLGRESKGDSIWLPLALVRAGLGVARLPFPTRCFRMLLGWPGKEGQARSITTVTEENMQ